MKECASCGTLVGDQALDCPKCWSKKFVKRKDKEQISCPNCGEMNYKERKSCIICNRPMYLV